ncbi:hypothetical protein PInf_007465 [Phytophthora infestans]|nr:hypothetical protein PInf_007465 [Phytophthora infestans]
MDAEELAVFTDLFHAMEYPLYTRLAPGQKVWKDMPREVMLRFIKAGEEAAPNQKQEVQEFTRTMSRITLAVDKRIITVTFKGKQAASKWIGWNMPFGSKLLPLTDYKGQRERAKKTHEAIAMDFYEFTMAVRSGAVSFRDMHWILTQGLGLDVQELKHPDDSTGGTNDKEWVVTVKRPSCPESIRNHNTNEGRDDGDEKQNKDVSASYTSKVDDDPGTPARDGRKMEAGIKYPEQASVQTHEQTEDILMKEDMFEFQAAEQAESSNTDEEGSAPRNVADLQQNEL